jgi:hypothetical protein
MKYQPFVPNQSKYAKFLEKVAQGKIPLERSNPIGMGLGQNRRGIPRTFAPIIDDGYMVGSGSGSSLVKIVSPTAQSVAQSLASIKRQGKKRRRAPSKHVAKKRAKISKPKAHKKKRKARKVQKGKRKVKRRKSVKGKGKKKKRSLRKTNRVSRNTRRVSRKKKDIFV